MSWGKLLRHDLRCGLLRWRYLLAPLLFLIPCLMAQQDFAWYGESGGWADYLLYIFRGKEALSQLTPESSVQLPMLWLVAVGGCLLLNLDYLLRDLTSEGLQVILRGRTRVGWFLSKCVWNLCSCLVYFCAAGLMALVFTLAFGGEVTLACPDRHAMLLFGPEARGLTAGQGVLVALAAPLLTLMALSMLEMALCLAVKPIVSFFVSMALLVASVYVNSPLALGNGAMTKRSSLVGTGTIEAGPAAAAAMAVILASVLLGVLAFRRTDILGLEE